MEDRLKLDVAVIGGGISGLYTAWRLSGMDTGLNRKRVQIFEASDRIGGRLQSVTLPGMTIIGELGGMRYLDDQKIVATLIEQNFQGLLHHVPFEMGDKDGHRLLFYGRKQRCFQNAWTDGQKKGKPFETRYSVASGVTGFSANQMFNKVIGDVLLGDSWFCKEYPGRVTGQGTYNYQIKITGEDWDEIKPNLHYCFKGPYKGLKLNSLGFWNVIKDQIGEEAYDFLSVAGGYYSITCNCNAAEAFAKMVIDFSDLKITYKTIEGGYDKIAYAIAENYQHQLDSKIWIKNSLETFERQADGSDYRYKLTILNKDASKSWVVYANAIVLAMPPRSLELLNQNNFFFNPEKQKKLQTNMASVMKQPSFKLLMGFEKAWWDKDFGPGHSITDLPIRQCYYFGKYSCPDDSHALFLASYNDMRTVSFWEPMEPSALRESFTPTETSLVCADDLDPYRTVQATKAMVKEAMKEIRELHGKDKKQIPNPYVTWFKDWSLDPYGAGYHFWNAGVDVRSVMPFMRKPMEAEAIHICGEAFSGHQGWVEGALIEAEKMLGQHFNLCRPSWLDPTYYLGW